MFKANNKELEFINKRYGDVKEDLILGIDYCGEGLEVIDFEVDDNGRTTMLVEECYLNNQYALRYRHYERHPRLKQNEIDYLLGRTNNLD